IYYKGQVIFADTAVSYREDNADFNYNQCLQTLQNGKMLKQKTVTFNTDKNTTEYSPFPEDRISVDAKNRSVEFKLLPNENVELFSVNDKLDNDYEKEMNLANLRINSADGSISLEGRQVFKSFRPIKSSWYSFGPETSGFVLEYR
ncbi:MAG: hypothetical protein ABJB40_07710, partial [Acidobacteriota bacterium]